MQHRDKATIGVISFGLAVGLTMAFFVLLLGLSAALFDWGLLLVHVLSSVYIGFMPNFVGSVAGAVWAFVDGFAAGALVAWLYNRFLIMRQ